MGVMVFNGFDTEQNYSEALEWYRKAAEQGNHRAQTALCDMFKKGQGMEPENIEALDWWKRRTVTGYAALYNALTAQFPDWETCSEMAKARQSAWRKYSQLCASKDGQRSLS